MAIRESKKAAELSIPDVAKEVAELRAALAPFCFPGQKAEGNGSVNVNVERCDIRQARRALG